MGVPLGTFSFPPVVTVGLTDTIIQRTDDVNLPVGGTGVTSLLMRALQLESTVPTDFGLGADFYFITLQSARPTGGPASTGTMAITLSSLDDHLPGTPEGTFSSSLDVFFDVRKGSLSGPIALSSDLVLTSSGSFWDADPPPGTFLVTGAPGDPIANFHTGKSSTQMDFFPALISESHPTGAIHVVRPTQASPIPEPASLLLLGTVVVGIAGKIRRKLSH